MIKVTSMSSGHLEVWVPPESILACWANVDGLGARLRLRNGDTYNVQETCIDIEAMITAAYHRRQL